MAYQYSNMPTGIFYAAVGSEMLHLAERNSSYEKFQNLKSIISCGPAWQNTTEALFKKTIWKTFWDVWKIHKSCTKSCFHCFNLNCVFLLIKYFICWYYFFYYFFLYLIDWFLFFLCPFLLLLLFFFSFFLNTFMDAM